MKNKFHSRIVKSLLSFAQVQIRHTATPAKSFYTSKALIVRLDPQLSLAKVLDATTVESTLPRFKASIVRPTVPLTLSFGLIPTSPSPASEENGSASLFVVPAVKYSNAELQKKSIIKDNRRKSGVYRITHIESGKSYVGSSVDLGKRLSQYFSFNYINDPKRNMSIHKAILKYDYSAFSIEVLEYCKPEDTIKREQYYLDLYQPIYNILRTAGSSLGRIISEETRLKMKAPKSPENLAKIRAHLAELNSREMPSDIRAKISAGMAKFNVSTKGRPVKLTNLETGVTKDYASIREAARSMDASRATLTRYLKRQALYLDKYKIEYLS